MTQTATQRSVKSYLGREQRRYVRLPCEWPVKLHETGGSSAKKSYSAKCKDLSAGGIKVTSLSSLERHSKTIIDIDRAKLASLIRSKKMESDEKNKVLAEVVWRRLNLQTGLFEMGLRFLE